MSEKRIEEPVRLPSQALKAIMVDRQSLISGVMPINTFANRFLEGITDINKGGMLNHEAISIYLQVPLLDTLKRFREISQTSDPNFESMQISDADLKVRQLLGVARMMGLDKDPGPKGDYIRYIESKYTDKFAENQLKVEKENKLKLKFTAESVASRQHPHRNEDSIYFSESGQFAIICDGMGGAVQGDRASAKALEVIKDALPNSASKNAFEKEFICTEMENALAKANQEVFSELKGEGGTTAVVAMIAKDRNGDDFVVFGHIGDSRAYTYNSESGTLHRQTDDDSPGGDPALDLVTKKEDLKDDLMQMRFDMRNILNKYIGQKDSVPHIKVVPIKKGDKIILTSDGVHDNLTLFEIENSIKNKPDGPTPAYYLVNQAIKRSNDHTHLRAKEDDISAIVIEIE